MVDAVNGSFGGRGARGVIITWGLGVGGIDPIFAELAGSIVILSLSINTGSIGVDGVFRVFVKYAGCRSEDGSRCHAFLSTAKAIAFLLMGHLLHSGAA